MSNPVFFAADPFAVCSMKTVFAFVTLFAVLRVTVLAVEPINVRSRLLAAAKEQDKDFPKAPDTVLTHFSHLGEVVTADGQRIYVADCRAVIANMLAPRGLNYIVLFGQDFRFLGKFRYVKSRPLWCEGGKLFLFGDLDDGPYGEGNVIDFSAGFEKFKVYHASVYGSSGGIRD